MEMETEALNVAATWWNDLPPYLQMEILSGLPQEFVYRYRIVSKQWNDLLSSNYFTTRFCEWRIRKQPFLVVLDLNPQKPCMSFCFYTRTWVKSSAATLTLSFVEEWLPTPFHRRLVDIRSPQPAAGLVLVCAAPRGPLFGKVYNPYTRTFAEIPALSTPWYAECIVVDENKNLVSECAYKVVVVRYAYGFGGFTVDIYEPSKKRWILAGYLPDDLILPLDNKLHFCNGSFYCYWRSCVVRFTIPLEGNGNGNGSTAAPIPVLLAPWPEWDDGRHALFFPRIITCGSRLLLVSGKWIPVEGGEVGEARAAEVVIRVWELKIKDDSSVLPSRWWEWVDIARMPPLVWKEWMDKVPEVCIGVGDHVCFIAETIVSQQRVIEVLDYNLMDNTWNWLPRFVTNYRSTTDEDFCWTAMAFEPRPYLKVN